MRHRQLKKWDTATWNMQTQPTLSTRTHWESRHLLWGDVAHSGMGLHLAWLLDRRKQPQIWGKEWKGKHVYINTCFNILKHHSSEEYICPYISLRLFVCWLTWLLTEQHTYEWSKKTSVHPFVGYHLLHPWYSPIYYTPWLSLLHIFEPLTSLFPLMMTKVQLQLASLQKNKTSQKHLCGCQPSGHARHRKLGLSQWSPQRRSRYSKHDFINVSSKKYQWKSKRSRDLN